LKKFVLAALLFSGAGLINACRDANKVAKTLSSTPGAPVSAPPSQTSTTAHLLNPPEGFELLVKCERKLIAPAPTDGNMSSDVSDAYDVFRGAIRAGKVSMCFEYFVEKSASDSSRASSLEEATSR
jgi:hypothetical protein